MNKERATVAALWVACALLLVALALAINVWWQWQHCGTPLARCAPAQVAPCERVDVIRAEWNDLINRAKAQNGGR
jgi:hypothetical protein